MKYKSVILPVAKEDLREAAKWYIRHNPDLEKSWWRDFVCDCPNSEPTRLVAK